MMNERRTRRTESIDSDLTAARQPMALSKYGRCREWFLKEASDDHLQQPALGGKLTAPDGDRPGGSESDGEIMPELAKRAGATNTESERPDVLRSSLMNTCKRRRQKKS